MNEACFDCWALVVIARCALQVRLDDADDVFEHYELIREANTFADEPSSGNEGDG